MREVAAEFRKPVMLYSIGKDSSVMLHLARKAFFPGKPPFPLLHVDTLWKFREMIAFRDATASRLGIELIVHTNEEGVRGGINPIASGSALHTAVMKTEALKQALDQSGFDAAFGGARRDEEKSRAKERVFSLRGANHDWDPRNQRPELWRLYNTRLLRARDDARLSAVELDRARRLGIHRRRGNRRGAVVFRRMRPVVARGGDLDHGRRRPPAADARRGAGEPAGPLPHPRLLPADRGDRIGGRDPGRNPGRAARSRDSSERQGRLIDSDEDAAMERKKREGYF